MEKDERYIAKNEIRIDGAKAFIGIMKAFIIFIIADYIFHLIGLILYFYVGSFYSNLAAHIFLILFALLCALIFRPGFKKNLNIKPIPLKTGFLSILFGAGFSLLANDILALFISFFPVSSEAYFDKIEMLENGIPYLLRVFIIAVIPALSEELFFRGILLSSMRPCGDTFTCIASAVFFAAMHNNLYQGVFAFCVGLVLGWILLKTGSIYITMLIHFGINFYGETFEYFIEKFDLYPGIGYLIISIGAAIFAVSVFLKHLKNEENEIMN